MIAGVILAGGAGSRIGGHKALAPFRRDTLIDAVIERVQSQVDALALSVPTVGADAYRSRFEGRYPLLFDTLADTGPSAGIVAGLEWARGTAPWIATFPCDTPFLPRDLVAQLMRVAGDAPVAARHAERLHGVCAVWPVSCVERLRASVEQGQLRSLRGALDHLGGTVCDVVAGPDAFFNINTPDDLARAEATAASNP